MPSASPSDEPFSDAHRRILSGIQPSGEMTLGNYLGAVENWVTYQEKGLECFYCVVDYHAITVEHEAGELARFTLRLAGDLLACGIDPAKSALFVQSQIPEHTELAWVLTTNAAFGELSRMTQFKEKSEGRKFVSAGLFCYPILQAADVLVYKPSEVPVGEDQVQHLEFTRSIARRFNSRFGETFPDPKAMLTQTPRVMSPAEPERKMSKSAGPKHYIGVFEPEASIRKKIRSHVTDTGFEKRSDDDIPPGVANLLTLLEAAGGKGLATEMSQAEKEGKLMYKDLKAEVADHLVALLAPIQDRRAALSDDDIRRALRQGGERAREVATTTMREVREKIGLLAL